MDWTEPCWWDDFIIYPLLEKLNYFEILDLDITRAFELIRSFQRRKEFENAIIWFESQKNNIEKGHNLPQLRDSKGRLIDIQPVNQDAVLKDIMDLD